MKVTLPDGTALELADGATGADAARAIGEGLARAALGDQGRTASCATCRAPLRDGAQIEIVTAKSGGRRARADPPRRGARAGRPPSIELYPGVKVSIGPPIDDGFYYDFEFPEGVKVSEDDLERIEAEDARAHQGRRARSSAATSRRRGARALPRRGRGLQGRADRGPDARTRASRPSRSTATARSPTSAAARTAPATKRIKAFKLTSRRRRLLARRRRAARCSPASTAPRSSRRRTSSEHLERLEQARARDHRKLGQELDLFMFSRAVARLAVLAAERHGTSGTS